MQKELKVDMDWRPPQSWIVAYTYAMDTLLMTYLHGNSRDWSWEETKHGFHIRIYLREPIEDVEAMMLQFLLGDDRVRCKLNYGRWKAGIEDWNKLWKCKVGR